MASFILRINTVVLKVRTGEDRKEAFGTKNEKRHPDNGGLPKPTFLPTYPTDLPNINFSMVYPFIAPPIALFVQLGGRHGDVVNLQEKQAEDG